VSRSLRARLDDITAACTAIADHLAHADGNEGMAFDAIRVRLIEIGEAAKDLDPDLVASEPDIPWALLTRMRDHLAHRYFDTTHAVVFDTARQDIPRLAAAVSRMSARR